MHRIVSDIHGAEGGTCSQRRIVNVLVLYPIAIIIFYLLRNYLPDPLLSIIDIAIILVASTIVINLLIIAFCLLDGAQLTAEEIVAYKRFKKYSFRYEEFSSLVLVFGQNHHPSRGINGSYNFFDASLRFYPHVSCFFSKETPIYEEGAVLSEIEKDQSSMPLTSLHIENGIVIQSYECVFCSHRFKDIGAIFNLFRGEYYIANSVLGEYEKELHEYLEEYSVDETRIHVLPDRRVSFNSFGIYKRL